jgi:hypothetical protein
MASAGFTAKVKLPCAVLLNESVTVTEKETDVVPEGGVPDRNPAILNVSQDGNPVATQVYPLPLPPDAVKFAEYSVPTVPAGSGDVLLMVTAAFTGSVKLPCPVLLNESVTVTEKETDVVPAGGVPDRNPAMVNVSQDGNPVATHVYPVPLPPDAVKFAEYSVPTVPAGSGDVLLMVTAAFTGNVKLPCAVLLNESVTVTEKETDVVPEGGVPDRNPAAVRLSHDGSPVAIQLYPMPLPPEASKFAE